MVVGVAVGVVVGVAKRLVVGVAVGRPVGVGVVESVWLAKIMILVIFGNIFILTCQFWISSTEVTV